MKIRNVGRAACLAVVTLGLSMVFLGGALATGCVGEDPVPVAGGGGLDATVAEAGDLCNVYCAEILSNCNGADRQYRSEAECKTACALLPIGSDNDRTGNTVNCRLLQARAATGQPACTAAGAYGGDVCGKRCDAFCAIAVAHCGSLGATAPYASNGDCLEECGKFRLDPSVGEGPDQVFQGDDNLNCRGYHLILSFDDKTRHCPHAGVTSATCFRDAGADAN